MIEEWQPVVGFEGSYEVSSLGRVRSLPRDVGAYFLPGGHRNLVEDADGYLRVRLRAGGKYHTCKVHRLVCEAFHGPPNVLQRETHHIDKNRANNRADNLRWVSRGENLHFRQVAGERNGFAKLTEAAVRDMRAGGDAKELAAKYGVKRNTIYDVRLRRSWAHID